MPETIKKQRGQFFTTNTAVQKVLGSLLHNHGSLLEPSAGAGDLLLLAEEQHKYDEIVGFELDETIINKSHSLIYYGNFFVLANSCEEKFDSILGNPPFVAWKNVEADTINAAEIVKQKYQDKTNLYHLFIDRCVDLLKPGGELVFIVPKEWLYTTSAQPLREKLLQTGTITHIVDCGEEKLFLDADVPALLIFRFQKGTNHSVEHNHVYFASTIQDALQNDWEDRQLIAQLGRFMLLPEAIASTIATWGLLKDHFSVKVGMVSGADSIFRLDEDTEKTIETEAKRLFMTTKGREWFLDVNQYSMLDDIPPHARNYVIEHKDALLKRRIAKFDATNFWKYGAIRNEQAMANKNDHFYAFVKTRNPQPFFIDNSVSYYGGGILGIFRKQDALVSDETAVKVLNSPTYRKILEAMFLTTGNKVSLQPATLEDAPFPLTEQAALEYLQQ